MVNLKAIINKCACLRLLILNHQCSAERYTDHTDHNKMFQIHKMHRQIFHCKNIYVSVCRSHFFFPQLHILLKQKFILHFFKFQFKRGDEESEKTLFSVPDYIGFTCRNIGNFLNFLHMISIIHSFLYQIYQMFWGFCTIIFRIQNFW